MSYRLKATDERVEDLDFGAFSFLSLLEACGYLFPSILIGGRWHMAPTDDARYERCDYPPILGNDGFEVTELEAGVMARVARNFASMQRSLPGHVYQCEPEVGAPVGPGGIRSIVVGSSGESPVLWIGPEKIRPDMVDRIEAFAEWAERSGGFRIW